MGYTHYWKFKGLFDEDARKAWEGAVPAIRDILTRHDRIICREHDDPETKVMLPSPDNPVIRFNGKGDEGHETFHVDLSKPKRDFCKTARKPYDLPVCEILLVLLWHIPGFEVSSDGGKDAPLSEWDKNWPIAAREVNARYGVKSVAEKGEDGNYTLRPARARNAGRLGPRWRCPACGSAHLAVAVKVWATLVQDGDGDFQTNTEDHSLPDRDHEFDGDSSIVCRKCGAGGKVSGFAASNKDEPENERSGRHGQEIHERG